jgi:hypothetical protein
VEEYRQVRVILEPSLTLPPHRLKGEPRDPR